MKIEMLIETQNENQNQSIDSLLFFVLNFSSVSKLSKKSGGYNYIIWNNFSENVSISINK